MEYIQVQNLNQYEIDFMNSTIMNNFNINLIEDNGNAPLIYNPALFQTVILIQFFQNKNILKSNVICSE